MDKLSKSLDPLALIIGGIVALLGALGVFSKLGLSVDQMQIIEGALLAIAAGTRKWVIDARTNATPKEFVDANADEANAAQNE